MRLSRVAVDAARRCSANDGFGNIRHRALQAVAPQAVSSRHRGYASFAFSCGNGDFGRLGHGSTGVGESALGLSTDLFKKIALPVGAIAVSSGGAHTAIVGTDGAVYTCGLNDFGQLGVATAISHLTQARKVDGLPNEYDPVIDVQCGHFHTICLTRDGEVWSFGRNDDGQCGVPLSGGARSDTSAITAPAWLESLSQSAPGGRDAGKVVKIAAGPRHSIAVTENGAMFTWGSSFEGCLGHGGDAIGDDAGEQRKASFGIFDSVKKFLQKKSKIQRTPRLVRSLAMSQVKAKHPSLGLAHSLVLDQKGTVFAWGQGRFNQLGVGARMNVAWVETPTALEFGGGGEDGKNNSSTGDGTGGLPVNTTVTSIAAGGNFSVAITNDGRLASWGVNGNGECGSGSLDDGRRDRPRGVKHPVDNKRPVHFESVSAGWRHAAAVTKDGRLFTWGWGGSAGQHTDDAFTTGGQLGLGDGQCDFWEPMPVPGFGVSGRETNLKVKSVSAGFNHTAVIADDGK